MNALDELDDLFEFVRGRLREELAAPPEDDRTVAPTFIRWGLDELDHLERDLRTGHRSDREVASYLRGMALAFDDHPSFRAEWRQPV